MKKGGKKRRRVRRTGVPYIHVNSISQYSEPDNKYLTKMTEKKKKKGRDENLYRFRGKPSKSPVEYYSNYFGAQVKG